MLLVGLFFAASASAASGSARIVLVAPDGAELARKVRAEAEHVGIAIASERGPAPSGDAELLHKHGAVGLVELASPDRVRIHVAASGEHGAYDTSIERAAADGDGFALRVVEQVRGRLVELRILPPEPDADARERSANPPPARDATSSRLGEDSPDARHRASLHSPTLGLAVGGAGTAAVGGLGATPGVSFGMRLEPTPRWAATLRALFPVAENDVFAREGEASAQVSLFLAELGYRLAPTARLQPEIGPGAGFVVLSMEAEAEAPREAHTEDVVAGVYFLHAGAGFTTTSWLRLRATARAGMSAPRPVLRFSEREVAAWGRGFVSGTLEAEFQLPLSGAEATP